ncbi:MAG: flagellar basal body P-ring formation protein FlgA [Rhodospirillales bacterium]|nr:flagellar basal body P-ring formation protein FlgA [Alphaproteobacteria bacterium]USO02961.1 MAG: flagellar basal body P-ring formation protein FlgA [Rhodospirillales bacterium]
MTLKFLWVNFALTLRIVLFVLALGIGVATLIAGTQAALAANLKNISIVTGDELKLGDLFDGLEKNADYVLGPAPQPGKDMVLNARTLYRISTALNLSWRPASSSEQIIVRRAATVVPQNKIEEALKEALSGEGLEGRYNLLISGGDQQMILPHGLPDSVEVSSIKFDPRRDIFEAALVAPSKETPVKRLSLMGQVERMVAVPILKSTLRNGDIIGKHDLNWIEMPARQIQHDTLLKEKNLVGMTPQRISFAGKPLLASDLESPKLVERGDIITITFKDGPLFLSTKGKALQSGAKGEIVHVANLSSKKSLEAVVTGTREVIVR